MERNIMEYEGKSTPNRVLQDQVEVDVPHVQQMYRWDCGLACTQMVLRYLDVNIDDFKDICKSLRFGDSVWTIDLANILVHYGIKHSFCTITLGVDTNYSNKTFYRSQFQKDEQRVNDIFQNADKIGINVHKRSVTQEEILQHLSSENILVVLTDWSKLNCKWCKKKCCLHPNFGCMAPCPSAYQGHFIVVCGYSAKDKVIFYHNPSYKQKLCCCSMKVFEQARKSYGTDEDILFIFKENTEVQNSS